MWMARMSIDNDTAKNMPFGRYRSDDIRLQMTGFISLI